MQEGVDSRDSRAVADQQREAVAFPFAALGGQIVDTHISQRRQGNGKQGQ